MDRLRRARGRSEPEMGGHGRSSRVRGPASVLARALRLTSAASPDVAATAPVSADLTQRREARVPAVARDPQAVDSGTAVDRDAPATLGAGTQHGERVVANDRPGRPAACLDRFPAAVLLVGKIDARQQEHTSAGAVAPSPRLGEQLSTTASSRRARGDAAS